MSVTNAAEDLCALVLANRLPGVEPGGVAFFECYVPDGDFRRPDSCDRVLYDPAAHAVDWRCGTLAELTDLLGDAPPDLEELCARVADPDPR